MFTGTEMQLQQYNAADKSKNLRQGIKPRLTLISGQNIFYRYQLQLFYNIYQIY